MKLNKVVLYILSLVMLFSSFSFVNVAAEEADYAISYDFDNQKDGDADGTVTISGISSDVTKINLYWGDDQSTALENYYNIATYTLEGCTSTDYSATKLEPDEDKKVTYTFKNGRLIPEGAACIIAEVYTGGEEAAKKLSFEIPTEKRLNINKDEMLYSTVWSSDFHAVNTAVLANSRERVGIADFVRLSDIDPQKFKGVIFNGDIADSGLDYQYAIIEDIFDENNIDFPIYYSTGNHDVAVTINGVVNDISSQAAKALDVRFKKLKDQFGLEFDRSDPWSYETYIGGHHYIFLASPYVTHYDFTDHQAKWLEEKLCYDEKSGVPTFVFTHMPWKNSGLTSTDGAPSGNKIDEIIARHPSVVWITSHVHMEPNTDQTTFNIAETGHTPAIDTGAVTYTVAYNQSKTKLTGGYSKYVQVWPDRIIMRTRNHAEQKWVAKAEHIIYVDDYGKTIGGNFTISSDGAEGEIKAGTVLCAKLDGADIDTSDYSVEWFDMNGTSLGTGKEYTVETADASVSAKLSRTSDGAYAYAVARYIAPKQDEGNGDGETEETPGDSLEFADTTTVKYCGDIVYVCGTADSSNAGEEATMAIISKSDYPDLSKAKYFGYCQIASDGSYMFKFKADEVSANDVFLIKAGTSEVAANHIAKKGDDEELVEVSAVINDDNTVSVTTKNVYADVTDAKVIISMYNPQTGEMIKNLSSDYKLAFGENGEYQSFVSQAVEQSAKVKVFLWTNFAQLKPLSGGVEAGVVNIPSSETDNSSEDDISSQNGEE